MAVQDEYKRPQELIVFNQGDDLLFPVPVKLPKLEEWYSKLYGRELTYDEAIKLVDGYGKAAKNQKFEYQQMPEKLVVIRNYIRKRKKAKKDDDVVRLEEIYEHLLEEQKYYENEIKWIKKQIRRGIHGYWFFCNGVPTYITGAHYLFLNFWNIGYSKNKRKKGYPEYRDRDRRWFIFEQDCRTTTYGWFRYKITYVPNGAIDYETAYRNTLEGITKIKDSAQTYIIEEDDGGYYADTGQRTCYGMVYPKHRREGATTKVAFMLWYCAAFLRMGGNAFIQSQNDDQAGDVYQKNISNQFESLPFFLQLNHDPATTNQLYFTFPKSRAVGATNDLSDPNAMMPHNGTITYKSSKTKAVDGYEAAAILHDELGKVDSTANIDVYERLLIAKKTLEIGTDIVGTMYAISTVGEMSKGGGARYRDICVDSNLNKSSDNGRTMSGLRILFFPAYDGFAGKIDEYGASIIENPKTPVVTQNGTKTTVGAKEYLLNEREVLMNEKDDVKLLEHYHAYPLCLKDAFLSSSKGSVFPVLRIRTRLNDLAFDSNVYTRRYRLEWKEKFKSVNIIPDDNGLHVFSYIPHPTELNLQEFDSDMQCVKPSMSVFGKYILGFDPHKMAKEDVQGSRKSFTAGVTFYKRDYRVDPEDKPKWIDKDGNATTPDNENKIDNWVSERWIHHYKDREGTPEFQNEEAAKLCVLLGALLYPEQNLPSIIYYFRENGLGGYLLYEVNENTGEREKLPGRYTGGSSTATKHLLFQEGETHLRSNVEREYHSEILADFLEIVDIDEMTKHDIFTAATYSLLGAKSKYINFAIESEDFNNNFGDWSPPTYEYE